MAIIDYDGKYLLAEFAYGIHSNDVEELRKIHQAVANPQFDQFLCSLSPSSNFNKQIFKHSKRDFYKTFR